MADVIDYKVVARNVRVARAKKGFSQKQLATMSGVCEATISFIESAKHTMIRMSTLTKLAEVLDVEVGDLLKE